jgi:hypothetical protein
MRIVPDKIQKIINCTEMSSGMTYDYHLVNQLNKNYLIVLSC